MNHNIQYLNWTFGPDQIREGNLYLATSLLNSSLEVNVLSATVECDDRSILDFERNTPLSYYTQPDRPMIFRVQSIKRAGPETYSISATSTLGLLSEGLHYGGIYTGQTAQEVIADICGTVPFVVKSNLEGIKLYGWLPIASPRDNLAQVLFAIGAALKTDLDGVLRIEGLWDGISGTVTRNDMYTEAAVEYDGKVTQVIVSEHQYVPWTEEKQLFEGTAQAGDIITFDEPMHSLKADGFSIQASGANWARVSAGSGVLSGKTYLHNTRQISKDVWPAKEPNVKTVKEATLVSLVNSQACAQRMADYYRCRERVDAPVVYHGELPGDRLATYHPFDRTATDACLESADITLSNTLKAQEKSLVGFVPVQIGSVQYLDHREVLTGSGTWTPPKGVKEVTVVLIGAGQGGKAGKKGGDGSSRSYSYTYEILSIVKNGTGLGPGPGGAAGDGGDPGNGGKIYQSILNVENLNSITYQCGVGGIGASFDPNNPDADGGQGSETRFHNLSSALGSSSNAGYLDIITGEIFAKRGEKGIAGGRGVGRDDTIEWETLFKVTLADNVIDEDGNVWKPGHTILQTSTSRQDWVDGDGDSASFSGNLMNGTAAAEFSYGLGSGAAAGANGTTINNGWYQCTRSSDGKVITAKAKQSQGADGKTPTLVPRKPGYGQGGRGGYGGGGGASPGYADYSTGKAPSSSLLGSFNTGLTSSRPGIGGNGGKAGDGGDGIIILYYSVPEEIPSVQLVDKYGRMILDRLRRRIIV